MIAFILAIAFSGIASNSVHFQDTFIRVMCEGDSNTYSPWMAAGVYSWPTQTAAKYRPSEIQFRNNAYSGKTVATMVAQAATLIDPYYRPGDICILLGGANDLSGGATVSQVYQLQKTFCLARRAVGWHTIVMTYPTCNLYPSVEALNDSLRAGWATFADGIIDLDANAIIGYAGDHTDPAYFRDTVHLNENGLAIVADSVAKRIELDLRWR